MQKKYQRKNASFAVKSKRAPYVLTCDCKEQREFLVIFMQKKISAHMVGNQFAIHQSLI